MAAIRFTPEIEVKPCCEMVAKATRMDSGPDRRQLISDSSEMAAIYGHLRCLVLAQQVEPGAIDERTCHAAAYAGSFDCMRFAHRKRVHLDHWTCDYAVVGKRSDGMRLYLKHERGIQWDYKTSHYYSLKLFGCAHHASENSPPVKFYSSVNKLSRGSMDMVLKCLVYDHMLNGCESATPGPGPMNKCMILNHVHEKPDCTGWIQYKVKLLLHTNSYPEILD